MSAATTVCARIFDQSGLGQDATALICTATKTKLDYGSLKEHVLTLAGHFRRDSVVVLVLPNSIQFVVTFLAVLAAGATVAPLNPKYTESEFDFYIQDLKASTVVVPAGQAGSERHAAAKAALRSKDKIRVMASQSVDRLVEVSEAGATKQNGSSVNATDYAQISPDHTALLLHTSGTTGKPKLVPLLHRNLVAGAENVAETLKLTHGVGSCALQVFFHIHGIQAALLAPLFTAGYIAVPPSVDGATIWHQFAEHGCRWLTATPSILQVLLAAPLPADGVQVDFMRSCSSPLLPSTHKALEERFGCPVVEAYAMTEASHQMASNTFDQRQSGTVGFPQGNVRLAIFDDSSPEPLQNGQAGEVAVSGPSVTPGYIGRPEANEKAFFQHDGRRWFRTGDRGTFDDKGRLQLLGRFSEIVNRGGEKISPPEVDEAMMLASSEVKEAASFAVSDEFYGQEIEAAVVLKDGKKSKLHGDQQAFQKLLEDRLAGFKIPKRIHFCENTIPKGPTGKIQRHILSKTFASSASQNGMTADGGQRSNGLDTTGSRELIAAALRVEPAEIKADQMLLELGADSITFSRIARIAQQHGALQVDMAYLFSNPTIGELQLKIKEGATKAKQQSTDRGPATEPFALLDRLSDSLEHLTSEAGVSPQDVEDAMPLSASQGYFASVIDFAPDTNVIFQRDRFRIKQGVASLDEWEEAWRQTVRLEPSLRTILTRTGSGQKAQLVLKPEMGVKHMSWTRLRPSDGEEIKKIEDGLRHAPGAPTVYFVVMPVDEHDADHRPAFDFWMMHSHLFTEGQTRQHVLRTFPSVLAGDLKKASQYAGAQRPWRDMVASASPEQPVSDRTKAFWQRQSDVFWKPIDELDGCARVRSMLELCQGQEKNLVSVVDDVIDLYGDWTRLCLSFGSTLPMIVEAAFSIALSLFFYQFDEHASRFSGRVVYDRAISARDLVALDGADSLRGFTGGYAPTHCHLALARSSLVEYVQMYTRRRHEEEQYVGDALPRMAEMVRHSVKFAWRVMDESGVPSWNRLVDRAASDVQMNSTAFFSCYVTASRPSSDKVQLSIGDALWREQLGMQTPNRSLAELFASLLQTLVDSDAGKIISLTLDDLQEAILDGK